MTEILCTMPAPSADVATVYTLWLSQKPDGRDVATATFAGDEFTVTTKSGATMALARKLVAAGARAGRWVARGSDGKRRMHGGSLYRLAALSVRETDAGQRGFVPFVPDPRTEHSPAWPAATSPYAAHSERLVL